MPPRMETRSREANQGNAPPDITQIVAQQLNAAIPKIVTQVTAGMITSRRNTEDGGAADNPNGCTYKTFLTCKPKEFHGKEGAVGLLKWIESMETMLYISRCAENRMVEYASCQLQDRALTWWKTQMQIRGRAAAYQLTWEEFTNLLLEEYCSKSERQQLESEFWNHSMIGAEIENYTVRFHELARLVLHMVTPEEKRIDRYIWGLVPEIRGMVTSANPTTIHSAVVLANRLTNDLIRSGVIFKDQRDNKRKAGTQFGMKSRGNSNKKQKVVKNFGATTQEAGPPTKPKPWCNECNESHSGGCRRCYKCNQVGHYAKHCTVNTEGPIVCYECGSPEHLRNDCPRKNRGTNTNAKGQGNQRNHGGQARRRGFVERADEA